MSEGREIQKELFQELVQPAKSRKGILYSETAKRVHSVTFTNEQLIFAFIGFIILLVICFSLGVERGKRIVPVKKEASEDVAIEMPVKMPVKAAEAPIEPAVAKKTFAPYVIQVASYRDSGQAEGELRFLERKGYTAEIATSGRYSVVYVVGFADKKSAQNAVNKLKDRYKDCFMKERK